MSQHTGIVLRGQAITNDINKRWTKFDLGGGGLQSANLRLTALLRKRGSAYALLALAYWQVHPKLTIIGGVSYNPRRDVPVIPGLGVRWEFADRWDLLLVYPVPRIRFEAGERITLHAGVRRIQPLQQNDPRIRHPA